MAAASAGRTSGKNSRRFEGGKKTTQNIQSSKKPIYRKAKVNSSQLSFDF